ncbi:MAG: B12-binding domain-containing radical SAM protein [Muribaculaceae bacterium]|nr:B12-binding domain-containing radical SAM protein [Muribaculaceae bacterium]
MKITFLIPPCYDNPQPAERSAGCTRVVYPMINIYELTLAAVLRNEGYDVAYKDFVFHNHSFADFRNFIANDDSDAYIIWMVNLSIESDLRAVADIRKSHPLIPIVMCGPGPTYFPHKCLADRNVYILRGEPEATAVEFFKVLSGNPRPTQETLSGIKGLTFLNDGKVTTNPPRPLIKDLDALPFPARDLLGDQVYHNPKLKTGPYTTMFTSRNCPYGCKYCVPSSLTFAREIEFKADPANNNRKPTIGFRSVENVTEEINLLASQGYKAIGFMDDNFIWNETRTAEICKPLRRHGMKWGCQARVDAITEPIARMLGESGCMYVDLGVESFDADILKSINKGITPADIYRAVNLLKKYNVPVKLNILIGCSPLETTATVRQTFREAKRLKVDQVMFNIVSPFPGTEYYKTCKENGWIKGDEYRPTDVQHESILNLPNLSAKQMEKLLFQNNLSFFLDPAFIWKQIRRFSSFTEFISAAKALKLKLFH